MPGDNHWARRSALPQHPATCGRKSNVGFPRNLSGSSLCVLLLVVATVRLADGSLLLNLERHPLPPTSSLLHLYIDSQVTFVSLLRSVLLMFPNDLIDDAVVLALLGIHDEIAFHVLFNLLQLLTGMLRHDLVHDLAHAQNLARMNIDVGCLP